MHSTLSVHHSTQTHMTNSHPLKVLSFTLFLYFSLCGSFSMLFVHPYFILRSHLYLSTRLSLRKCSTQATDAHYSTHTNVHGLIMSLQMGLYVQRSLLIIGLITLPLLTLYYNAERILLAIAQDAEVGWRWDVAQLLISAAAVSGLLSFFCSFAVPLFFLSLRTSSTF